MYAKSVSMSVCICICELFQFCSENVYCVYTYVLVAILSVDVFAGASAVFCNIHFLWSLTSYIASTIFPELRSIKCV